MSYRNEHWEDLKFPDQEYDYDVEDLSIDPDDDLPLRDEEDYDIEESD